MHGIRTCACLLFAIVSSLTLIACSNSPLVRVCDPCGCKCVAAPLLTGCGPIPRAVEVPAPPKGAPGANDPSSEEAASAPKPARDAQEVLEGTTIQVFKLESANLDQAIALLRTSVELNFYITPKVREEKFDDVIVTVHFQDVTGATVLDMLTQPFGLRWEVRGVVVWILTREEVGGPMRLRYFDVKDLVGEDRAFRDQADLLDRIRADVHPRYWVEEEEDAHLEAVNGILIVRASRGMLEGVEGLLTAARREARPAVVPADVSKALAAIRITLKVENEPLASVVASLQAQTGKNLMLDPRVAPDVARNPVLGLSLEEVALPTALALLAAAAGEDFVWTQSGGVLMLTLAEHANRRSR